MRIAIIAHIRHPIATPFMGGMEAHYYYFGYLNYCVTCFCMTVFLS